MEVCLFITLAGVGYLLNKGRQPGMGDAYAGATLTTSASVGSSGGGDVPSVNSVYDSRYLVTARADEARRVQAKAALAMDPVKTGVIGRGQSQSMRRPAVHQDPVMVSPLSGQTIAIESFTHNNMVPFYSGSSVKQNTGDGAFQGRMETFTGTDAEFMMGRKLERAPLFQPERNQLFGMQVDVLRDAYMQNMPAPRNRAHEAPAPELVRRPGVVGGGTDFDARVSEMPRNVDELRVASNPKKTFAGRVLPGRLNTANARIADQPVVMNMRPTMVAEQKVQDLCPTKGALTREAQRPVEDVRNTTRQDNSRHFVGPAAPGDRAANIYRDTASRESFRAHLAAPQVGPAAPATGKHVHDYGRAGIQVYSNERDITTTRVHRGNLVTAVKALMAPLQDLVRDTRKDSMIGAPRAFGNINAGRLVRATVYDANDVARTTIKEAGLVEAPLANLRGMTTSLTVYDPDDVMRATMRETGLVEAPLTNLRGPNARTIHDPDDVMRTTGKEAALHEAPNANLRSHTYASTVYDPNDIARTTGKEAALHEAPNANLRSHTYAATVYDPNDIARTTGKEASLFEAPNANLHSHTYVSTVYDPNDIARTTGKDASLFEAPNANLRSHTYASTVYDPNDVSRTTGKETSLHQAPSTNLRSHTYASTVHDPNDIARTTGKETALVAGNGGVITTSRHAPRAIDPEDRARVTTRQTTRPGDTTRNFGSAVRGNTAYDADAWRPQTTAKQIAAESGRGNAEDGNIGGLQGHGLGAYETTEYDARDTQKQALADSGIAYGGAAIAAGSGYIVGAPDDARDTMRQATSDSDYYGHGRAGQAAQMSYEDTAAAQIDAGRELLEHGREPTASSVKLAVSTDAYGQGQRERQLLDHVAQQMPTGARYAAPPTSLLVGDASIGGRQEYQWDSGDRLEDEVAGAASQLADNPFAVRR